MDDELGRIEQFAVYRRDGLARWHLHRLRATRAALVGELGAAVEHNEAARAVAIEIGTLSTIGMYYTFLNELAPQAGKGLAPGPGGRQGGRAALSQDTAAEIAKKYGGSLKETPLISQKDPVPGLGPAPAFTQGTALQLKPGEVSRVVELPGGCAVTKSLEYQAENLPPFSQVKDQVVQQVKKQGAMKDAEKRRPSCWPACGKGNPWLRWLRRPACSWSFPVSAEICSGDGST